MSKFSVFKFFKTLVLLFFIAIIVYFVIYAFFPDMSIRFFGTTFRSSSYVEKNLSEDARRGMTGEDIKNMISEYGGNLREMLSSSSFSEKVKDFADYGKKIISEITPVFSSDD